MQVPHPMVDYGAPRTALPVPGSSAARRVSPPRPTDPEAHPVRCSSRAARSAEGESGAPPSPVREMFLSGTADAEAAPDAPDAPGASVPLRVRRMVGSEAAPARWPTAEDLMLARPRAAATALVLSSRSTEGHEGQDDR